MTKEDIQFMKDYVDYRVPMAQAGILSFSEVKVCKIFIKILEKEDKVEKSDK